MTVVLLMADNHRTQPIFLRRVINSQTGCYIDCMTNDYEILSAREIYDAGHTAVPTCCADLERGYDGEPSLLVLWSARSESDLPQSLLF